MTTQLAFLERIIALLDKAGIPYMVAGSLDLNRDCSEAGEQAERIDGFEK